VVHISTFGGASVLASRTWRQSEAAAARQQPRPTKLWYHPNLNAVDKTVFLNQSVIVPPETFQASRLTRGNFLFPTIIEVSDRAVIRHKRSWFSKDEISISISKVASVHIKTGIIWADILIESSGGSDPLASHGHRKADARRIRELVETAQGSLSGGTGQGSQS
jgi:hypothetical protein